MGLLKVIKLSANILFMQMSLSNKYRMRWCSDWSSKSVCFWLHIKRTFGLEGLTHIIKGWRKAGSLCGTLLPLPLQSCATPSHPSLFCSTSIGGWWVKNSHWLSHSLDNSIFSLENLLVYYCLVSFFLSCNLFRFLNSRVSRMLKFLLWLVIKDCCEAWRHKRHQSDILTSCYREQSGSSVDLHY